MCGFVVDLHRRLRSCASRYSYVPLAVCISLSASRCLPPAVCLYVPLAVCLSLYLPLLFSVCAPRCLPLAVCLPASRLHGGGNVSVYSGMGTDESTIEDIEEIITTKTQDNPNIFFGKI